MFFSISKNHYSDHPVFTQKHSVKQFCLSLDSGWQCHNDIWYKGYCVGSNLQDKVKSKNFISTQGSYCILDFSNELQVHFDSDRSFPLSFTDEHVTNLPHPNSQLAHIDASVQFHNNRFEWVSYPHKKFASHPEVNFDDAVDTVIDCLLDYVKKCNLQNTYCGYTQGVDTGVIQSVLDYLGIDFKTANRQEEYQAPDHARALGWGFKNNVYIHNANVFTGYYGDEFVLRNPYFVNHILSNCGVDLNKEFDARPDCYMKQFYDKNYRHKTDKAKQDHSLAFDSLDQARKHVFNIMVNDFQIWHFGTTSNIIPFRNFELARILLHADCDTIIKQVTGAEISLAIINRLSPKRARDISKIKNIRT